VTLTWNAPAPVGNTPIQGYNVYRSATSGGTYELVVSRIPAPTYTDSTVNSGKTYYYVVTTIDQSGAESKYSDEIRATVP
jgi:fibronectin type 3 domain-containing protein